MAPPWMTETQFSALMVVAGAAVGGAWSWLSSKGQARTQALINQRSVGVEVTDKLVKGLEWRVENIERALSKCEERCERQVGQLDSQLDQIRELRRQNMRQGDEIAELKRQNAIQTMRLSAVEKKTIGDGSEPSGD